MISVRRADDRGVAKRGWLDSRHTFSFGGYHDPDHMGFATLRVINEDVIQPGQGFGTHSHRDMEIVTYILDGALEHKDSIGNGSVLRPGEVQRMSAGTGIEHSEFNPSPTDIVHLLQIWIVPERKGLAPDYEQKSFPEHGRRGKLRLVGARDGRDGAVTIHQDVDLYATILEDGADVTHPLRPGRKAWVQVARGAVRLNGRPLSQGDGAAISDEGTLTFTGTPDAEVLLFDMG